MQQASPKIAAILTRYERRSDESDTSTSNNATTTSDELSEWQTPDMPILTARQLELSLLEIRRRNRHEEARLSHSTITDSSNNNRKEAAILVPICTVQGTPSILFTRRSAQLSSHASQISFPGGYYDEELDANTHTTHDGTNSEVWKNKLIGTAIREMQEELQYDIHNFTGIHKHAMFLHQHAGEMGGVHHATTTKPPFLSILGQTQPVPAMSGSKVTPIIGSINYDLPHHTSTEFSQSLFPGNSDEVDWIFTIPIEDLIRNETSEPLQRWSTNYSNSNNDDDDDENNDGNNIKKTKQNEYWGPVFPIPDDYYMKKENDKIWGFTAIVLRAVLRKVIRPVFSVMNDNHRSAMN